MSNDKKNDRSSNSDDPAIKKPHRHAPDDDKTRGRVEARPIDDASSRPTIPPHIGHYRIIRLLGQGGMGLVYEAEQEHPRRRVALKVVRGGAYVDQDHLMLFHREAQSLARLKHPGIAAIYEAGRTDDGQHFFAMELVPGVPLNEYVRATNLPTRGRLELFRKICEAISYAHQHSVIHRDLKPSNILVDAEGNPKILDFGLAKITDSDVAVTKVATEVGKIQGTLPYMSPEQARGRPDLIELRSDVYSLGIILYELVTGQLPYGVHQAMLHEAVRIICEDPPRRPSTVNRSLKGDIETIVLKSLEKEPSRRYQTADALSQDIDRYLRDQPILASPPSLTYQFEKLVRRHKVAFGAAAAIVVALLGGFIVSTSLYLRAEAARREAVLEKARSEQVATFLSEMLAGVGPAVAQGHDTTILRAILEKTAERISIDLEDQPEVYADLSHTIGITYLALGLYDQADSMLRPALEIRQSIFPGDHSKVAQSLDDVAALAYYRGQFTEAEQLYRDALAMWRNLVGNDHLSVAIALNNLGNCLRDQGRIPEAEPLFRETLEIRRRLRGDRHPDFANALSQIALLLQLQGKLAEAEPLFREALAITREHLGDEHPSVPLAFSGLAALLHQRGSLGEAEELSRKALEIQRKILGEEHPNVALALNNLAVLVQDQGRLSEAEQLHAEALAMRRKLLGAEHRDIATSLNNLAYLLYRQGKLSEAEPLYREALAMHRKLMGEGHPDASIDALNLGRLLRDKGELDQAEAFLRQAVDGMIATAGEEHWMTAVARSHLGDCLGRMQNYVEAERELLAAHQVLKRSLGDEHDRTINVVKFLAALYEAWEKPDKAAQYRSMLESSE